MKLDKMVTVLFLLLIAVAFPSSAKVIAREEAPPSNTQISGNESDSELDLVKFDNADSKALPALIPLAIVGVRIAYTAWKASRTAQAAGRAAQTLEHLRRRCASLYDAYKNRIKVFACTDRCNMVMDQVKRDSCFSILIPEIKQNLDKLTAEIDAREAFFEMCAKPKIGQKLNGEPWEADDGHEIQIADKKRARDNCNDIDKRRNRELAGRDSHRGRGKGLDGPVDKEATTEETSR